MRRAVRPGPVYRHGVPRTFRTKLAPTEAGEYAGPTSASTSEASTPSLPAMKKRLASGRWKCTDQDINGHAVGKLMHVEFCQS